MSQGTMAQYMQVLLEKSKETHELVEKQIFSQTMTGNLIDDLLDLAKVQNN